MAARQQGHMVGRGWLQALQGGLPPESSWSGGCCMQARVPPRASADAKTPFAGHSAWRAGQQATVSYALAVSVKALRGLVVGKAVTVESMHACRAAGDDGNGTASAARSRISIVSSSISRTLDRSVRTYVIEYGRSACDTYEISRRQPRGLTTPEPGGKVF
jgi:hypothetical protein